MNTFTEDTRHDDGYAEAPYSWHTEVLNSITYITGLEVIDQNNYISLSLSNDMTDTSIDFYETKVIICIEGVSKKTIHLDDYRKQSNNFDSLFTLDGLKAMITAFES